MKNCARILALVLICSGIILCCIGGALYCFLPPIIQDAIAKVGIAILKSQNETIG